MIEILFLLGFSLHNIEEALWLPQWSQNILAFINQCQIMNFFAVIMVTAIGYLFTFQYFVFGSTYAIAKFAYLGFILMMVFNTFFPHILSTIYLKKYAPGTLTALLLNFPIGSYLIFKEIHSLEDLQFLLISTAVISIAILILINFLFKIGKSINE
ncbi:MAG: HXXEE domain-containing protein [Leptospiraceae bacterium]|nr:HXXEE domain-containing protein [Leptospiraceae bacterium]